MSNMQLVGDLSEVPAAVLDQFSAAQQAALLTLRRDLHAHPELAFAETRTARVLEEALAAANPIAVQSVAGTGLVARIRGRNPHAPVVAIRGDIDALPIHGQPVCRLRRRTPVSCMPADTTCTPRGR